MVKGGENAIQDTYVLVTGSRDWRDNQIIEVILRGLFDVIDGQDGVMNLVHGAAKGADSLADEEAIKINFSNKALRMDDIVIHREEAWWKTQGKAAGVIRNQRMLDTYPIDVAFAFHEDLENSKGTRDMTMRLAKAEVPTYLITRIA